MGDEQKGMAKIFDPFERLANKMYAETKELKARIAELEADKRRLDWIKEHKPSITFKRNGCRIMYYTEFRLVEYFAPTLDEAIDKAMQ